jgi:uncharacterized protein YndB with AHSA1/START domain
MFQGVRMQDRWKVEIKAPPDKVWAYVGDLTKHAEWSPKTYRANWLSGSADAVGSKFESFGWVPGKPENRMEGEVTENDSPRRYAVKSWGEKPGETFVNTFVLTSNAGSTTVEKIQDAPDPTGFMKIGWPILNTVFVHGAQQKGMDMLKAKVEGAS